MSARELLAQHPPAEAFRSWMTVFIDWAATKHGMTDTLRALYRPGGSNTAVCGRN